MSNFWSRAFIFFKKRAPFVRDIDAMPPTNRLQIALYPLLRNIANATDLISPILVNHHKKVSFIAATLGQTIGLPQAAVEQLAIAGAVHDIGGLSIRRRLDSFDFEELNPDLHAVPGFVLLSSFPPFAELARLILFHHVCWQNGRGREYRGKQVPVLSHLLHLADRIAVRIDPRQEILSQKQEIIRDIGERSGKVFVPEQVAAFRETAAKEVFWLDLSAPEVSEILQERLQLRKLRLAYEELPDLAQLFRKIIDFRSRFTSTHSSGVAAVAVALAAKSGFDQDYHKQMLLAGLLHDVGKLVVPAEILGKQTPMSAGDFAVIRKHPYYSAAILRDIEGFSEISHWAAWHHERLDGSGYPYRLSGAELPAGARILAVADTFTALTENRPYRCAVTRHGSDQIMQRMAAYNKLDPHYVAMVHDHLDEFDYLRQTAQSAANTDHQNFLADCQLQDPDRDLAEFCP
jgi:HD-GYP domain-containing protein (c-di-GMP phosphodiesterase class II)